MEHDRKMGRAAEGWGPRNTAAISIASRLVFDRISHRFGDTPVLDDVSIPVEPGEVLCLLGPSGSGKSTLMRIAAGIEHPGGGRLWIDDRLVAGDGVSVPPDKRGVGLVFQDHALFPHLCVLDNVLFGLSKMPAALAREEAGRMLRRVGMEGHGGLYPHQLSGGEQQRVALARALAPRPGILLLDEPFSGLDSRLRDSVREETIGLLKDTRSTAVIVTHDPEEALRVGDHIALMREGRLVQHGTGEDLYYRPKSLFAARFFSELNRFDTVARTGAADTVIGRYPAHGFADASAVVVCLRLADIQVSPLTGGKAGRGVAGRIAARRFVGIAELLDIYVDGRDEPVRARIRAGSLAPETTEVAVWADEEAAMVFPGG
jgi:iron(III) transport system ATP-binding protein